MGPIAAFPRRGISRSCATSLSAILLILLRRPEENEFLPLSILCGNEGVISDIQKKYEEMSNQEELDSKVESGDIVEMSPDELDNFFKEDSAGDILFVEDPNELEKKLKWESADTKQALESLVKPIEEKDKHLETPNLIEGERKQSSRLKLK